MPQQIGIHRVRAVPSTGPGLRGLRREPQALHQRPHMASPDGPCLPARESDAASAPRSGWSCPAPTERWWPLGGRARRRQPSAVWESWSPWRESWA